MFGNINKTVEHVAIANIGEDKQLVAFVESTDGTGLVGLLVTGLQRLRPEERQETAIRLGDKDLQVTLGRRENLTRVELMLKKN